MATYKLIQDIEAEDHILGPLTLRQFIFALISVFCFYICFLLLTKHVAFLIVLFLPPALFFGFFAVPFGRDQPTEVWALAKIRFFLKPRKRIWDQSGVKELVTIPVPKKVERVLTNGLSPYEVDSRLKALANTLDSRGWAVKNANLGMAPAPYVTGASSSGSDRLIDMDSIPAAVPDENVPAGADVLDETSSPLAQQFTQMIDQSSHEYRERLIQQMNTATTQPSSVSNNNQWFMPKVDTTPSPITAPDVAAKSETPAEAALAKQLKNQRNTQQTYYGNLRTLQPLGAQPKTNGSAAPASGQAQPVQSPTAALTAQPDPAILSLANNNDFTVDTIAREAKRAKGDEPDQNEVVISLR